MERIALFSARKGTSGHIYIILVAILHCGLKLDKFAPRRVFSPALLPIRSLQMLLPALVDRT